MSFPTISSIKSNNAHEHEQGSVQGALYGARALASGGWQRVSLHCTTVRSVALGVLSHGCT